MTSRSQIEATIKSAYAARLKGDLEGTLKDFAEDCVFRLHGRGTGVPALSKPAVGKAEIRPVMRELIDMWRFDNLTQVSLLIDGEKAMLHSHARVTCIPTKKSDDFDVFDLITFRDGKIVDFRQSTDTALVMKLATP
jgi:ketosteroid isomerase-like protein